MKKLGLWIGAAALARARWLREHLYSWLVLGPLVLGMAYLTAARVTGNLPAWRPAPLTAWLLASAGVLVLVGLSLSRASAEIYHLRRPESYFESLPVPTATHLNAALAARFGRALAVALLIAVLDHILGGSLREDLLAPLPIFAFAALLALGDLFAALNWIHWNHTRNLAAALAAAAVLAITALLAGAEVLRVLDLEPPAPVGAWRVLSFAWAAALYVLTERLHARWRAADLEYARRLQRPGRRSLFAARRFGRRFPPPVAAQMARDLQLTARGFSSAVYVVLLAVGLTAAALVVVLETGWLPPAFEVTSWFDATWLPSVMAVKVATVAMVVALGALVPALVYYELPHLWLERAVGTSGLEVWRAKLWYARLVSLPAPLLAWAAGALTGELPFAYLLPLLAECLFVCWLMSSIMGALSYEMPARPGIATVVMTLVGGAGGVFAAMLWPFGVIIYAQAMHSLAERGRQRARYYLMTEAD